ncbi:hypothetical protein TanjilG_10383 [Lupinus angustifolius]|uniref:Uncharacterized protein n=1 Tax=Lupinus angustifolius TaxID=3871 RepID=A0A4P1R495_LUPAN|nr:hypothetical protein TanjilG_10383 [Lupinus angustifolius]
MELRHCSHDVHFIQAIKGGLVSKELNVTCGRPTLSFKQVTDIYDDAKAEPDASVCKANDNRSCDLDDNDLENITLKQFHVRCKTRKRKYPHDIDSSKTNNEIEVPSSPENNREKQMSPDDPDFLETLSTLKSKLSKKIKRIKEILNTYTQESIPVVKSKETHIGQEFAPSCGDLLALVEENPEVPETDCLDHSMELRNVSDSSSACDGPDYYSGIVAREEADIAHECYIENDNNNNQALIPLGGECCLENELSHVREDHDDFIPLQMAPASCKDIVVSNPEFTSNQSPNFPAIEFASEDCIILPDVHHISPQAISLVEDHHSNVYDNEPDGDTSVSLPNVATPECLDCMDLSYRDGRTLLSDCSKNEFTTDAEVHAKTSSTSEHDFNPGGSLVSSSNDSPESMEKLSFSSIHDDEGEHKTEATNELISLNEHCSSDLDHPKGLLSNRKTLLPSSEDSFCKAMQLIDTDNKDFLKCREKLYNGEQSGIKNGTASGLDETRSARFVDNPKKVSNSMKTSKGDFHPKGILKFPYCSRPERDLSTGCSSFQSYPFTTSITFSKRQMHDVEMLTTKLTKELKTMKDILDDMLRSEFCLNTSLRYKVNEKKAQHGMSKGKGNVSFADQVGGTLCEVRLFKSDQTSLLPSITGKESSCNNLLSITEKESSCNNLPSASEKESSCNNLPSTSEKESSCNNLPSTSEKEKRLQ